MGKEYLPQVQVLSTLPSPADVILADDFEGILKWSINWTGGGFGKKNPAAAYLGNYGLQLKTRETDATIDDYVEATQYPGMIRGKHFEASIRIHNAWDPFVGGILLWFLVWDPTKRTSYGFRYDFKEGKWYYLDANNDWSHLSGLTQRPDDMTWNVPKLIIDASKREYLSLDTGQEIANLSGLPGYIIANPDHYFGSKATIRVYNTEAHFSDFWIDQVYIRPVPPV